MTTHDHPFPSVPLPVPLHMPPRLPHPARPRRCLTFAHRRPPRRALLPASQPASTAIRPLPPSKKHLQPHPLFRPLSATSACRFFQCSCCSLMLSTLVFSI
ncbi:hypothetical protein BS50DRAFT_50064 [Corynespora cassiicola Philippines]|uniref:Uncharacterized protein n=1 Tax=Corynespora cassiicola Philippines TaxID=1448308 RepID=A0A2T2NHZ1_CORCC|nr:hypothetical protein BS50DRAFT_50064 [Corynespora cassiicola Philippines]